MRKMRRSRKATLFLTMMSLVVGSIAMRPMLPNANATAQQGWKEQILQHMFNAYLDITLQSPAGTVVTITTDNGGSNDDVFNGTVWDDQANPGGQVPYTTNNGLVTDQAYVNLVTATPLVPEEAMGAFIG